MDDFKNLKTCDIQGFIHREESILQSMFKEYQHLIHQERKAYIFYEINSNINSNRTAFYSAHNKLDEFSNEVLTKWKFLNSLRDELHRRLKAGEKGVYSVSDSSF